MDFERYAFTSRRPLAMATNGMVATSQVPAVLAGLDILQRGGNAVDAAVAAAATLCVVEPGSTGIGGDAFALIWWAGEQQLFGLNASGAAPIGLTADWIRSRGHQEMPESGPLTVTVPAALRGWQLALERFGSLGLDTLLARPIAYARHGFPVSRQVAEDWAEAAGRLSEHPESQRIWLPAGQSPRAGELFANPALASTLEKLAEEGFEVFYGGEIGRQIVRCVQEAGGLMCEDDLAACRAEWVTPISTEYGRGAAFYEMPPNGQGLTALLALNLLAGFDLRGMGHGSADAWHLMIEAVKLAFADAEAYLADPRLAEVPVEGLLSLEYAAARRSLISLDRALLPAPGRPPRGGDTVYLSVVDRQGNMVSWIQSLYEAFGSGLTAGESGIALHNRGSNFVLEDGHPNQVSPGKRPYHTIIPGFISRDGRPWASFGVMGGFMQPQGHVQVGVRLIDFEMDPQVALDAPRFRWFGGRQIALEGAVPDMIYAELAARGHQILPRTEAEQVFFGGGQIIIRDPDSGLLIGGSDPRRDGAALGW